MASTAPGLAMRLELAEHFALDGHVLEHRFDHHVGVGHSGEIGRAGFINPMRCPTSSVDRPPRSAEA